MCMYSITKKIYDFDEYELDIISKIRIKLIKKFNYIENKYKKYIKNVQMFILPDANSDLIFKIKFNRNSFIYIEDKEKYKIIYPSDEGLANQLKICKANELCNDFLEQCEYEIDKIILLKQRIRGKYDN